MTHGDQTLLVSALRESGSQCCEYQVPLGEVISFAEWLGPEMCRAWVERVKARRVLQ